MSTSPCFRSRKLPLILILLIGALSASAITFGDTILAPLGFAREASSLSTLDSKAPAAGHPKRYRPGSLPGLTSPSMFALQITVDDQGADDEPGQKDLTLMGVDFGAPGSSTFRVIWQWDNTATTGNNTRDAGALFDTDGDGNANWSLYITVNTNGTYKTQLFDCTADSRADRCGGPDEILPPDTFASTAQIFTNGVDPFGPTGSDTTLSHSSGNTCIGRPGCYSLDTQADVNAVLSDFGNPDDILLLNVCSYPSGEPNSDPSDCVVEQAPGALTLVKVVDNGGLTYPELAEVSDFTLKIDGTNTTSGTQKTGLAAGNHTIEEVPITTPFDYAVGTWECSNEQSGTPGSATFVVDLAAGENVTCTITNTLQGDITPSLSVLKVDDGQTYSALGDVIDYTITVTNTGPVTLSNVAVTDATAVGLDCDPNTAGNQTTGFTLAPNGFITCTASHTVVQADLDAGHYSNAACADDGAGGADQACDDVDTPGDKRPHLTITKADDGDTYSAVGDVIDYTIVATNDGNVTLAAVTVTDPNASGLDCTPANGSSLAPDATMTCTATHTVVQADIDAGHYLNAACVDDGAGGATEACDDVDTPGDKRPHLTITKTDDGDTYSAVGDVIDYTIVATNDGNVTLAAVTVTDPNASGLTCTPANGSSLAPGASLNCTASHTVVQADIDAGSYFNAACVDDGTATGSAAEACDDVTTPGGKTPRLSIVKDDSNASFDSAGDTITYSIVATNTGNTTLAAVTVTDALATLGTCTPANGSSLAPGDSMTCSATYQVTQANLDAGTYRNTACVDDGAGGATEACDNEDTPGIQSPGISIVKSSTTTLIESEGQVVPYTFLVTNIGNVSLTGITVTDPNVTDMSCPQTALAVGGFMTCTASHTVTAGELGGTSLDNTATACGNPPTGAQVCAEDDFSIPVQPPLKGHLMHTGVTCSDFVSNDPSDELNFAEYVTKAGKVNNVAPGVMFYYGTITAPSSNFTYNLTQSNDAGWKPVPVQGLNQIILYTANCGKLNMVTGFDSAGKASINVTGATAGNNYIVGIKYSLSGLAGQLVEPPLETATYSFAANFNGNTPIASSEDSIPISAK